MAFQTKGLKPFIVGLVGMLIGVATMLGWGIDLTDPDKTMRELDLLIGACITIISIVSHLHHDIQIRKLDTQKNIEPAPQPGI